MEVRKLSDKSARNIKNYRKRKGLTQEELANKVGVSLMSIRRYETKGVQNRQPSADLFDKIADVLETTSDVLRGKESDYEFKDTVSDMDKDKKIRAFIGTIKNSYPNQEERTKKLEQLIYQIIENHESQNENNNQNWNPDFEKKASKIITLLSQLNDSGQNKAIEQVELLTKLPEFSKNDKQVLNNYLEYIKNKSPQYWENLKNILQKIDSDRNNTN